MSKKKKNASLKRNPKTIRPKRSQVGKVSGKSGTSRKGKTQKPTNKNKADISKKSKRKGAGKSIANAGRTRKKQSKARGSQYSTGKGEYNQQLTYWFPKDLPENQKVKNLQSWDAAPLQAFISKNRPVKRKGGYVLAVTKDPVTVEGAGYRAPESVWIKLVKRKPRGKETFFSSVLSPPDFVVNKTNVHAFSVGVLEKYYADFLGKVKDNEYVKNSKAKRKDKYKLKGSDPDDFEGKAMKIVAVIYHFIY